MNERHFRTGGGGVVRDELALEQIDEDAIELVAVDPRRAVGERRQQVASSAHTDDGHAGEGAFEAIYRVLRSRLPPVSRARRLAVRFDRRRHHDRRGRLVDDDVTGVAASVDDLDAAILVPALDERRLLARGLEVEQGPARYGVGDQHDPCGSADQGACGPMQRARRRNDHAGERGEKRRHEKHGRSLDDSHQRDGGDAGAGGGDQVRRVKRPDPRLIARERRGEECTRRHQPREEDQGLHRHRRQRWRCTCRRKCERCEERCEHRCREHPTERGKSRTVRALVHLAHAPSGRPDAADHEPGHHQRDRKEREVIEKENREEPGDRELEQQHRCGDAGDAEGESARRSRERQRKTHSRYAT